MRSAPPASRPKVVAELVLITVLYGMYRLGRLLANGNLSDAFANATRVWGWERAVRLPHEASVQALILHGEVLQKAANVFYTTVHFPATIAFLIWMFGRHPAHYVWVRRTLTVLTGAALLLHLAFPLAPPRMVPDFGLIDTGRLVGPSPYDEIDTEGLANQFAAMPSLHFGWALVVAIGLITVTRSPRRWLWLAHPALTLFVIVATANHYWIDAIVATALLTLALLLVRRPASPARPASTTPPTDASTPPSDRPEPASGLDPGRLPAPPVPPAPATPTAPSVPPTSAAPSLPATSAAPAVPATPTAPSVPPTPPAPSLPPTPATSAAPSLPATPSAPAVPAVPPQAVPKAPLSPFLRCEGSPGPA